VIVWFCSEPPLPTGYEEAQSEMTLRGVKRKARGENDPSVGKGVREMIHYCGGVLPSLQVFL